jgi:hypothetical protein
MVPWKKLPAYGLVLGGLYVGVVAGTVPVGLGLGLLAGFAYKGIVGGWEKKA